MKNINRVQRIYFIFLAIILVIVCFSFGKTYSKFIYESPSNRVAEIFVNKLNYKFTINSRETNEITIPSGNSVLNISMTSLNEKENYFKLFYNENKNIIIFLLNGNVSGKISNNEINNIKLFVINKSESEETLIFDIQSGYITNTLDDIVKPDNDSEIKDKINIGDYVEYKPIETSLALEKDYTGSNSIELETASINWQILDINDKAEITLISEEPINKINLNGSIGYNNGVYLLNDLCYKLYSSNDSKYVRNLNIEDIEKYLDTDVWDYNIQSNYKTYKNNLYYPTIWIKEKNVIINNKNIDGTLNKSESVELSKLTSYKETSSSITTINNYWSSSLIENNFKDKKMYKLLIRNELLSTRYTSTEEDNIEWGLIGIDDSSVVKNELYSSDNVNKEITGYLRPIITLKDSVILNYKNNILNIE
jgi:hypothetical protein